MQCRILSSYSYHLKWLLLMFILLVCHCLLSCVSVKGPVNSAPVHTVAHTCHKCYLTVNSTVAASCLQRTQMRCFFFFFSSSSADCSQHAVTMHHFYWSNRSWKSAFIPDTLNITSFLNTAAILLHYRHTYTHISSPTVRTPERHSLATLIPISSLYTLNHESLQARRL